MVITQNGKSAAVFMDIGVYESLLDKLDLLQEMETAEKELNEGKGISQSRAKKMLLGRVRK